MNKLIHTGQFALLFDAHFKEIIRQPSAVLWGFIFPVLLAVGLGLAFSEKDHIVRSAAIIEAGIHSGPDSRPDSVINAFLEKHAQRIPAQGDLPSRFRIDIDNGNLGRTTIYFIPSSWDKARSLLKQGKLSIVIEAGVERIYYHFDPLNTDAQMTYLKIKPLFDDNRSNTIGSRHEGVQSLTLSGTRYIDFLIPGLIAMSIMMSCMWGISFNVIEKRSRNMLRRMVATPMRKSHYLAAMMTVRMLRNFIEASILVFFAWVIFDVRIQGSIPALMTLFIAGNITFGGTAMLIASRTTSMESGNRLINAIVMPLTVLSGVFFSYHNFPDWSIPLIQALPLTLLADGIRSIFNEGAGFIDIAQPAAILAAVGIVLFYAGLKIFKWY